MMTNKINFLKISLLLLIPSLMVMTSCDDNADGISPEPEPANIKFVHAQTASSFDSLVAFMGTQLRLEGETGILRFEESTPYIQYPPVFEGANPRLNAAIYDADNEFSFWANVATTSEGRGMKAGRHYTFVALGVGIFATGGVVGDQGVFLEDDLTSPVNGSANIRIVHGMGTCTDLLVDCIEAPAVDVLIDDKDNDFQDMAFAGNTGVLGDDIDSFVAVTAGAHTLTVNEDETANTLLTINETFENRGIYTIILHGATGIGTQDYMVIKHN